MDTETLKQILIDEMKQCLDQMSDMHGYLTANDFETYTITTMFKIPGKCLISTVLVARLENDKVIIELDHTKRLFAHALKLRGVPEVQIVVAYSGNAILSS